MKEDVSCVEEEGSTTELLPGPGQGVQQEHDEDEGASEVADIVHLARHISMFYSELRPPL